MLTSQWLVAAVLGVVEGLTEFLPISSTGHLIIAGSWLGFTGEKAKVFEIVIQSGAIAAVIWQYRIKLFELDLFKNSSESNWVRQLLPLYTRLFIAFLPLALIGLTFNNLIKYWLFSPLPVAMALVLGGVIILLVERKVQTQVDKKTTITSIAQINYALTLKLGFLQALALIPGTSRSGATIIGGLWLGLSRSCATEFSFLLAVPTIVVATAYELFKNRTLLQLSDLPMFAIGWMCAFISAWLCIRWFIRFVANHNFIGFAWYRIILGIFIVTAYQWQWVTWN